MYLPLIKIIEAIGLPGAMKLVEKCGGTRIYLPLRENLREDQEIVLAVGIEDARKLAEACDFDRDPARHIEIPLARPQLRVLMRKEILRDSEHMSERQLARKYKTTQRTIRRIKAESGEAEAGPPGLF